MDNALAAGGTVTFHDTSTNKDYEVVDSLTTQTGGTYEISSSAVSAGTLGNANGFYAAVASAGTMTLAEGDEITIDGQTISMTDKKPMAVSDITKVVNELESGDMMVINHTQSNGTTTTSKITHIIIGSCPTIIIDSLQVIKISLITVARIIAIKIIIRKIQSQILIRQITKSKSKVI